MKRFYLFIFLVCTQIVSVKAQKLHLAYSDSIIEKPFNIWIKTYNNGVFSIKDSFLVTNENKQNIYFNLPNYIGYVEVVKDNKNANNGIGILFNPNEKEAIFLFNQEDIKTNNFLFKNSLDNIRYNLMIEYMDKFFQRFGALRKEKNTLNPFDSIYLNKVLQNESNQDALYAEMNLIVDSILKVDTALFTAKLADLLKTPCSTSLPTYKKYFDNFNALLHYHLFDYVNFADEHIINHPFFYDKIDQYFNLYCNATNIQNGIDILMQNASKNEKVKEVIINYLVSYFLSNKNDELVAYVYEKYGELCSINLGAKQMKEFSNIVHTQVGSTIPDIVLYDSKNNMQSLLQTASKNKYTIVYVWLSSCSACNTKTPKLSEEAKPYLNKGLSVFSISLDDKKDTWFESILKNQTDKWINVAELVSLQNSSILPKLNIRATPKLFIIDNKGTIIAKDIYQDELNSKLKSLFK